MGEAPAWKDCGQSSESVGKAKQVVLGTKLGVISTLAFVDLNGDGLADLLMSNEREVDGFVAAFAFLQPRSPGPRSYASTAWKAQAWPRYTLTNWSPRHALAYSSIPAWSLPVLRPEHAGRIDATCDASSASSCSGRMAPLASSALAFHRDTTAF